MQRRQDIERHFKLLKQAYEKIKPKLGYDFGAESDAFEAMLKQRDPKKISEMHKQLLELVKNIPLYNQGNDAIRAHFWAQIGPLDPKWQALFSGNDADMQLYGKLVAGQDTLKRLVEGYCRLAADYQAASNRQNKRDISINVTAKKNQLDALIEEYNEEHKKIIRRVQEIGKVRASLEKKYKPMESIERALEAASIMLKDKLSFDQRYGKGSAVELNSVLAKFNKDKSADNAVDTIEQVKKMLVHYITYLQGRITASNAHMLTNPAEKMEFLDSCCKKLEAGQYDQQIHLLFINLREMERELSQSRTVSTPQPPKGNTSDSRIVVELGGAAPKPLAKPVAMTNETAKEHLKAMQGKEPGRKNALREGLNRYLEQSMECYSLAKDILGGDHPSIQNHSRCHLEVQKYIKENVKEKGLNNNKGPEMVSKLEANRKAMQNALLEAGDKVFLQLDGMTRAEAKNESQEFLILDAARRKLAIKIKNAKDNGNAANIKALVDEIHDIQVRHFPKPTPPDNSAPPPVFNLR